jgi:hypothetical protein
MVAFNAIYPSAGTVAQPAPGVASGVGPANVQAQGSVMQKAQGSVGINDGVIGVIGFLALVLYLHHRG